MKKYYDAIALIILGIFFTILAFENSGLTAQTNIADKDAYREGITCYENNNSEKAVTLFKKALSTHFTDPASDKLQQAVNLAKSGKTDEAEKILLALMDEEATAARAMYELGLIYETQGKVDKAATVFRNAMVTINDKGAKYVGIKNCRKCHFKQYMSWKKTKMAKTFEVLKPKVRAEAKVKFNLDPKKDYTKDPDCLGCHTTGYGMLGGYKIPQKNDSKAKAAAKDNEGATCEACHGPGSKYAPIHEDIKDKKRQYTTDELRKAGQYEIKANVCTTCHNRRNPTVSADFHFDYEKNKAEDTHENSPLKYRAK